ncbi:uncharacterized protein DUF370 [Hydrogenispora ethanolica]|uniref:Uncharacterized protein DUF370 n=1 Tax=Hydrogenispora ethanolica TaxID=1082276 RepID=A0A4V2QGN6_HYDET|nr:extracellular matrix/biofilm biosynthesis regulator RemA family protein [Hydrogenispora ethanolica]TCL76337.1 uncharacterized protein DUF370 [Hydrogenispora ethanolica]
MFVHLGGDTLVRSDSIIAMINLENAKGLEQLKTFLKKNKNPEFLEKINLDEYKSAILTDQELLLSPISTLTLKKRADFIANL